MNMPGHEVQVDGIKCFAPEKMYDNDAFSSSIYSRLRAAEEYSFWFKSRNALIIRLIRKYFSGNGSLCEIGCGNAYVLSGIHRDIPTLSLSGSELYLQPLKDAGQRFPEASFFQADLCNFPCKDEFDIVGAFDVIEHIDDDDLALKNIFESLKPGGGLILTVPQHKWLWSNNDVFACHRRRYNRKALIAQLRKAGFYVEWSSSFMTFLIPLMYLSRIWNRNRKATVQSVFSELELHPVLNSFLGLICRIENIFISFGISFPIGGSLICIARKR